MQRKLKKDNKIYTIAFDEDGVINTVTCNGKSLHAGMSIVKTIVANQESIFLGRIIFGFEKVE